MLVGGSRIRAGLLDRPKSLEELGGPDLGRLRDSAVTRHAFADAVLDVELEPGESRSGEIETVLLTGATGFLGAYLVHELVSRLGVRVRCLVRAPSPAMARRRVEEALRRHRLWSESIMRSVEVVPGDLAMPRLGLTLAEYERLAATTDAIVHNGARVNHAESYTRLRAANVVGTMSMLRLACETAAIPMHLVSTTSVATRQHGPAREIVPSRPGSVDGYVLSKWVSEVLVSQAAARGLPAVIHRPDRICGGSTTGATGTDDAFWTFVRAIARLGLAPPIADAVVSLVPADFVAAAIAHTVGAPPAGRVPVHHLVNQTAIDMGTVLDRLRINGFPVEVTEPQHFLARLAEAAGTDIGMARALILSQMIGDLSNDWNDTNARNALSGSGIACPPMTPALIDSHLDHLIDRGFLRVNP
ncbi:thioester reductase domain-containing protein [Nocardia inohanensis]|uniref:thioester reductase domain-containing protein n=1 Tax=Nocardia inohanensis TaxID=209246 RepID=UPI000A027670|nr:thioester reductase domain-containing protein [Nocardia inohanensis]